MAALDLIDQYLRAADSAGAIGREADPLGRRVSQARPGFASQGTHGRDFQCAGGRAEFSFQLGGVGYTAPNYGSTPGGTFTLYAYRGTNVASRTAYNAPSQGAIGSFSQAIELDENCVNAYVARAKAYETLGEKGPARVDWRCVLELVRPMSGEADDARVALDRLGTD